MNAKKQLIVADDIRKLHKSGEKSVLLTARNSLVTAEARSVAGELGLKIIDFVPGGSAASKEPVGDSTDQVRQLVQKHLGDHGKHLSEKVAEEVFKRLGEYKSGTGVRKIGSLGVPTSAAKLVEFSCLPLQGIDGVAGAVELAGFLAWQGKQSWNKEKQTLFVIVSGELQCNGLLGAAKAVAGDIWLLPSDGPIQFTSEHTTIIFYVTYEGALK